VIRNAGGPVSGFESDSLLVDACLRGETAAWTRLVERYSRLVWSVGRKYGLSTQDAEDVHQTTFASLVRHLEDVRDRERLSSWLITTATRECWRLRRTRASRGGSEVGGGLSGGLDDLPDVPLPETDRHDEERQLVREGLARLNERCRDLLQVLFACDGEPHYPTIASQLDMPIGSIGPTRARCLAKLESILRSLGVGRD
jgi:RNA polymerase sigma factor (sigma-70 family)